MQARQLAIGLILCVLAVCHPKVSEAQFGFFGQPQQQQRGGFARQAPSRGSVSRANSQAYEREVDYGPVEFTKGVSNSRAVTRNNGGFRNGGTTSVAKSNAVSREVSLGGLDIGSTLTRTQTRTNGAVSRGVAHDLNIGNFGIGTSLSRDNLRNGFGLQREPDGGVSLGLGLLNIDLSRNQQQQNSQALTQAQVNAQGKNARVKSNSNSQTQQQNFGRVGVTETLSQSNAVGRVQRGQTNANTAGFGGDAATQAASRNYYRPRRTPAPASAYRQQVYQPQTYRQQVYRPQAASPQLRRPKRRAQFVPFAYPQGLRLRPRRQFQPSFGGFGGRPSYPSFARPSFGGFQQPAFGGFQRPTFGGFQPQQQNANAQGAANNKGALYEQQAGANTHSNNQLTANGLFQNNGASSIGSNVANDGSRGQVSSANTNEMNAFNADGSSSQQNNAQSQSLNFGPNRQQATSSNAGTTHTQGAGSERLEAVGGSMVTNNNQFGTATNTANTNSAVFNEGGRRGSQSDSSSQSTFQGANGGVAGALTNTESESVRGPNGFVSNSASSNASAHSTGGAPATANASSSAGSGAGGGFTNALANGGAGGGRGGGANANSGSAANFQGGAQGFANGFGGGFGRFRVRRISNVAQPTRSSFRTTARIPQQDEQEAFEVGDLRRPPGNFSRSHPVAGHAKINRTTEQFAEIDETQRQGRTFDLITDFINSLTQSCVYPCTLEAYRQNRCCEVVIQPQPPVPPVGVCCRPQLLPPPLLPPRPLPVPPPTRPPPIIVPPPVVGPPPINCCNSCNTYAYYGPPPCIRYNSGGLFNNFGGGIGGNIGGIGGSIGGSLGGIGGGIGVIGSTVATSLFGAANRVTIYVPSPPYFG